MKNFFNSKWFKLGIGTLFFLALIVILLVLQETFVAGTIFGMGIIILILVVKGWYDKNRGENEKLLKS